jgi:hypothetical protein
MKASRSRVSWEIVRENSPYNKRIKWFYREYREDGSTLMSQGFRTRRQAEECHENYVYNGNRGFPCGDHVHYTDYI